MSDSLLGDLSATIEVLEGRRMPVEGDETWLRHRIDSAEGKIDILLLEGT